MVGASIHSRLLSTARCPRTASVSGERVCLLMTACWPRDGGRPPVRDIFALCVCAATIMKDFKKNAQFPGFRKGTIPPFMLPKVKQFVILDCLEKTLGEAVKDEVSLLAHLLGVSLQSAKMQNYYC